jgi:putative intracellular protease/amidase
MRVLMVVSTATRIRLADDSVRPIGYWADEVAIPYRALREAGCEVEVATPWGHVPVADTASLKPDSETARFLRDLPGLKSPRILEDLEPLGIPYDAIYIPGGHAPMVDLAVSQSLGRMLRQAMEKNVLVTAICHGPAAFLAAREAGRPWPFEGYRIAAFTKAEEEAYLGHEKLPWHIEDHLREAGAVWCGGGVWESVVVRDRNVITGQNSESCRPFTAALVEALRERRAAPKSA